MSEATVEGVDALLRIIILNLPNIFLLCIRVYYCILDGADVNRQFIKLHFKDEQEAIERKFIAPNMYTGEPMVFLMDPKVTTFYIYTYTSMLLLFFIEQHNIKKIRNNILKSAKDSSGTRCLTLS